MAKKNRNKQLKMIYLLALVFFTVIMLTSSTYAWFTSNRVVTINTINVHVSNLRNKIKKASGKDYIETVWGIGYRLRSE